MGIFEAIMGSVTLVVMVSGAAATARWAVRTAGTDGTPERALVAIVSAVAEVLLATLVLAALGILGLWSFVAAQLLVTGAAWLATPDKQPGSPGDGWSTEGRLAVGLGTALLTLAAIPTLLGSPSVDIDTQEYHVAHVAHWIQTATLWELPFQNVTYFTATHPGNGEIVTTPLALATGGDHLLYLTPIAWGVIAVLAGATLTRLLGGLAGAGALAVAVVLTSNVGYHTQAHSLATDLTSASFLLAAVAFAVRAVRTGRPPWILLCGVATGISLGSKYTVLIPSAVLVLVVALLIRPRVRAAWLLPGLVVFAAPWFVRNWVTTGNPVFPQQLQLAGAVIFPGGAGPIMRLSTTIFDHMVHGRVSIIQRWARSVFELYGIAPILGAAGMLAAVARRSHVRLAVTAFALVCAVTYLITPYTGSGEAGGRLLIASGTRYLLPAMLLGGVLAATALQQRTRLVLALLGVVYGAYRIGLGIGYRPELDVDTARAVAAVAAGAVAFALVGGVRIPNPSLPRLRLLKVAGAVAVVAVMPSAVLALDRGLDRHPLEALVSEVGGDRVTVLGTRVVTPIIGRDLARRVESVTPPGVTTEPPHTDPSRLNSVLDESGSTVLVVGTMPDAVPPGWAPKADPAQVTRDLDGAAEDVTGETPAPEDVVTPGWRQVGNVGGTAVYVRDSVPVP